MRHTGVRGAVDGEVGDDEEARGQLRVAPAELNLGGRECARLEPHRRLQRARRLLRLALGGHCERRHRALARPTAALLPAHVLTARRHAHVVVRRRLCTRTQKNASLERT